MPNTYDVLDFLNPAEKKLFSFLEKNLSNEDENFTDCKKMINADYSLEKFVRSIITSYLYTTSNLSNPSEININTQAIPNTIRGNKRSTLIELLKACMPYYTEDYKQFKIRNDLSACENYLFELNKKSIIHANSPNNIEIINMKKNIVQKAIQVLKKDIVQEDIQILKKDIAQEEIQISKKPFDTIKLDYPELNAFKKHIHTNISLFQKQQDTAFDLFLEKIGIGKIINKLRQTFFGINATRSGQLVTSFLKPTASMSRLSF